MHAHLPRRSLALTMAVALCLSSQLPTVANAGGPGGPPAPPPPCDLVGNSLGGDLGAFLNQQVNVDLPATLNATAAGTVLNGYPSWSGSVSNASAASVSSPALTITSGLPAANFVVANGNGQLRSFPWTCGLPSLASGQQMQVWGIEQRNGTPVSQPVTQPIVTTTLGYDSSRSVTPLVLPAGGGSQTVSVSVTLRDARYAGVSPQSFSVLIQGGQGATVLSMAAPANLDAGEVVAPPPFGSDASWNLSSAVLGKTYVFTAVVQYANPFGVPWTHVPMVLINAFTPNVNCSACGGPGASATLPIPALGGGSTPGSAIFSVADTTHSWNVGTHTAYVARYFGGFWPDLNGESGPQLNAQLPPGADSSSATTSFAGYPTWTFQLKSGSDSGVTSPTISVATGYDPALLKIMNPPVPVTSLPVTYTQPSLAPFGGMNTRPIIGPNIPLTFQTGFASTRSVSPLVVPAGGGDQVVTLTVTPIDPAIRGVGIILSDNIRGTTLVSFTPPSNLSNGEFFSGPNPQQIAGWNLGNVQTGKTYAMSAVIHVPNPFGVAYVHRSSWGLFGRVPAPGGCAGCGGPSGSVTLAEPLLDGPTPGSGRITFSVAETTHVWQVDRQIARVVRYAPTLYAFFTGLSPSVSATGHDVTVSAQMRFGGWTAAVPAAAPEGGLPVTLAVGSQSCTGTTDATGLVSCVIPLDQPGGMSTLTASFAGNDLFYPATRSVPFTVISYAYLCQLTIAAVSNAGIATSLCAKLDAAAAADARGQVATAHHILGAYLNELDAQRGKTISDASADLLTRYAGLL